MTVRIVDFGLIREAKERIRPFVRRTPLVDFDGVISLKLENVHHGVGAFKIRGASNRLVDEPATSVVTAAIGSHGFAVGQVCKRLGKHSICFMPEFAPPEKMAKMHEMVDEVVLVGREFSETAFAAQIYALGNGLPFIHPYDDPLVIAGQGTIGLELAHVNDLTRVYVPVSGGGLISGIGVTLEAIRPEVQVIGVQSANMHAMKLSFDHGGMVHVPFVPSIAEPLCINPNPQAITFPYVQTFVHHFVLPTEKHIIEAMRRIYERTGHMVEGAGAIALAAALMEHESVVPNGRIVCIVSGGNISYERFEREVLDVPRDI